MLALQFPFDPEPLGGLEPIFHAQDLDMLLLGLHFDLEGSGRLWRLRGPEEVVQ